MSGIGPTGAPLDPSSLRRIDKDGSGGGGGGYSSGRRHKEEPHDEADFSEEALKKLKLIEEEAKKKALPEHVKMQEAAEAQPDSNNARLEILSEINHFNELHTRTGSLLKAVIRPLAGRAVLHIEDPNQGVDHKPFGDTDIYHHSVAAIRTKLDVFDHSSGSLFDGRV